ncbi:retrotransposon protein, putative, ty1-copia subclass [Tanacetum coccineum]
MTTSLAINSVFFKGFFEKQKLTRSNFIDWYRQLWIVLSIEDKLNYLEQSLPPAPTPLEGEQVAHEVLAAHTAWIKGSKEIAGLMLMTMEPEIQRNLENLHAYKMLQGLKTLFAPQDEQELLQTTREFHSCKQEEGQPVSSYVLKMKGYIDNLERLWHPVTLGLAVSLILIGLRNKFNGFVQNYNMHSLRKTINKLHAMLKLHEQTLPKNNAPALHAIRAGKVQKYAKIGHWKRNYPVYLAELLKKKKNTASGASGSAVEAIGIFYLSLPSGLVIFLNNCHYAPTITRGCIPRDGIFEIDLSYSYTNVGSIYAVSNKRAKLDLDSALLWHCRLGHINKKRIEKLQHKGLLSSTDLRAFEKCISCMSGKMARKPYIHQVERAKDLLGLIHTDVCSPFKIMSRQGASYFITFTDDFSHYGYIYLLKHKHEVFETFKVFQKEVENQLGKTIKSLCSDRGGEYMSQEFLDHLKDHGIITHHTPPYTPQHNGVSERRNRTLLDMVRSTMSQTTFPKSFWDYALETAAHILNMVPTKKVEKTPYKNKVLIARNAKFLENSLITQEASGSLEDLEIIQEEYTHPSIDTSLNHEEDDLEIDEPQSDIIPIRRSTRTRHAPDRMCLYIDVEEHELGDLGEPANYKATLLDPESDKWLNAMNVETQSMKDNEVWELVVLPPNGKTVDSKWLFKKKTDMDGAVHTYKARLVAKYSNPTVEPCHGIESSKWAIFGKQNWRYGMNQKPGYDAKLRANLEPTKGVSRLRQQDGGHGSRIDYEETFSPIADIRAISILIAIAAYYDYEIWQMDVKIAVLNGYLSEEVYMEQLEGFVNPKYPNQICKLKRSIYGLKQASRQWNKRFDDEIKKFGFTQNRNEPCVYLKASGSNVTFLILYVDDILIMGNKIPMLQDVKSYLGRCFAMKDLGEATYILGIKIYRDRSQRLIGLCQSAYIEKILKRFHMENSKRGSIPMQEKLRLSKSEGALTPAELKRIRFQQNPGELHWTIVKNILKYLRNTKDMFLVYKGDLKRELRVSYYTDVGYLTDADDLKSQTGYVFVLSGGAVDWKGAKQSIFTTSSAKDEYIASSDASREAV